MSNSPMVIAGATSTFRIFNPAYSNLSDAWSSLSMTKTISSWSGWLVCARMLSHSRESDAGRPRVGIMNEKVHSGMFLHLPILKIYRKSGLASFVPAVPNPVRWLAKSHWPAAILPTGENQSPGVPGRAMPIRHATPERLRLHRCGRVHHPGNGRRSGHACRCTQAVQPTEPHSVRGVYADHRRGLGSGPAKSHDARRPGTASADHQDHTVRVRPVAQRVAAGVRSRPGPIEYL